MGLGEQCFVELDLVDFEVLNNFLLAGTPLRTSSFKADDRVGKGRELSLLEGKPAGTTGSFGAEVFVPGSWRISLALGE